MNLNLFHQISELYVTVEKLYELADEILTSIEIPEEEDLSETNSSDSDSEYTPLPTPAGTSLLEKKKNQYH